MPMVILIAILSLPIIELIVLIEIGSEIGAINTVGLSFVTAGIGIYLVRLQGMQVMTQMNQAARSEQAVASPLVHGFFLLVAGFCLLIPGFITDIFGALLLIPPLRLLIAGKILKRVKTSQGFHQSTIIIDGEFSEVTPDEHDKEKDHPPKLG